MQIPVELLQLISSDQAHHYGIVPWKAYNGTIAFKAATTDTDLSRELEVILGKKVKLVKEKRELIEKLLYANYHRSAKKESLNYSSDFLQQILLSAKSIGSSDIHFEPYEQRSRIRFRIDGKLIEQFVIPPSDYPVIINKLKIQAGLDISERRLPQDGRISFKTSLQEFDIRVSTLPTMHGEKMVLRILTKDSATVDLNHLGFTKDEIKLYRQGIKKPNGIVLISGPTGSGKTTTLYATLKELNDHKTNILTIEDPIEYTLEGINQVQLKEDIGLDFTSALRTFLRQDPDIIMVGEIRDVKTANMAIRAALTGHLVLSTIHTNSAWATISRLLDMDIPSFLIASTLNMSVAQRLVRKLCHHCKSEVVLNHEILPKGVQLSTANKKVYHPKGCNSCHFTGYSGRQAIYEILPIKPSIKAHIKQADMDIDQYMRTEKLPTLKSNAIKLVEDGVTSIEEVYSILAG